MKFAFAIVVIVHAAIHLMGTAKAFGWASVPIEQPISHAMGIMWLLAALTLTCTAVLFFIWPQGWWLVGAAAVVLSQVAIVSAWKDARFGTSLPQGCRAQLGFYKRPARAERGQASANYGPAEESLQVSLSKIDLPW